MESARKALIEEYTRTLNAGEMRQRTSETMDALILALKDNAPSSPRSAIPSRDLLRPGVYLGYKVGELILVGSGAMRFEGQDPNNLTAVLGTAPNEYVQAIRAMPGDRGNVTNLVDLHEAACSRVQTTVTSLPNVVEDAYFRWSANEWGAVPLHESNDPFWLRVLLGMGDLPEGALDKLRQLRMERKHLR